MGCSTSEDSEKCDICIEEIHKKKTIFDLFLTFHTKGNKDLWLFMIFSNRQKQFNCFMI